MPHVDQDRILHVGKQVKAGFPHAKGRCDTSYIVVLIAIRQLILKVQTMLF